ncbi:hypothetical protein M0657_000966 [Pyricularia oryzae]|nr:hypothetical protein M9X92_009298 [Pyricularia oryzae]KAI7931952.1 hypothetical protein M0657_000966 [Pyricularia oryzae]
MLLSMAMKVTGHSHFHTVSAITMILSGRKSPHLLPSRFSRRVGPAYGSVLGPNGVKFKFARCLTNRPCWRNGITMRIMGKLISLPHPQTDN